MIHCMRAVLLALVTTAALAQSVPQGLLLEVHDAWRWRGKEREILKPFDVVSLGDSIEVGREGGVRLLWKDGTVEWLRSSRRVKEIGLKEAGIGLVLERGAAVRHWLNALDTERPNNYRSETLEGVQLTYPRNTNLRSAPEKLEWKGPAKRNYHVSLRCYDNGYSLVSDITDSTLNLDAGDVQPGLTHYWTVEYAGQNISDIPPAAWFAVLTPDQTSKVVADLVHLKTVMAPDTHAVSFLLLKATLLTTYELYAEAASLLTAIRDSQGKSDIIQGTLAFIYDKMDMRKECDQALRLSKAMHSPHK